jgi:hypothetical protein
MRQTLLPIRRPAGNGVTLSPSSAPVGDNPGFEFLACNSDALMMQSVDHAPEHANVHLHDCLAAAFHI